MTETCSFGSVALNQMSKYKIFSAGAFLVLPAMLTACGWSLSGEGDVDKPSWGDYMPVSYRLLGLAVTHYKPP